MAVTAVLVPVLRPRPACHACYLKAVRTRRAKIYETDFV